MSTGREPLTYVYAVARRTDRLAVLLAGLRGIDRAPVTLLTEASDSSPAPLAFVTSHVPHEAFNESALRAHFEDLEWLEGVARAHHEVVQAVAAEQTVLPLRMATVYQDDDRARQALGEQRSTFARRMAAVDAHTEYGVKIYLPPPAPAEPPAGAPAAEADLVAPTASPGKAYLQRRRVQHRARERTYEQAQRAAATLDAIAARYAVGRVRHAPQSGALTGPQENVLNDAYLVPDKEARDFRAAVAQAAGDFPEIRIEITGPWAPYSFAMPPAESSAPTEGERAP
ncbi:GvpL/GvpF family gas vesicle protein [Streptomyces sp. NRRL F-4474]|uniref:GvpL/GvpF family gas vesicle protein n=1 Tax=Streptomyces sp. NRRL F-4474 TaxID=1463851 RepID=UPI000568525B|nr:GvpL/GvpF family gas vesicle protein [Streptomyces sp. NRRL F-4474]